MAHFAKISEQNEILHVVAVDNKDTTRKSTGVEEEAVGQAYLEKHSNWPAHLWIQTSYNTKAGTHRLGGTPLRGNYAGLGDLWDAANNIFRAPKPYASWVLNTTDARWHSPLGDAPALTPEEVQSGAYYTWNEDGQSWDKETPTSSAIGEAPGLTDEQKAQNTANTHQWDYVWNEGGQSWDLTDAKA